MKNTVFTWIAGSFIAVATFSTLLPDTVPANPIPQSIDSLKTQVDKADALEVRFKNLFDQIVTHKQSLNKHFEGFYKAFGDLTKSYDSVQPSIKAIDFKPVSKLIESLFVFAESVLPIPDYLQKIQRILDGSKKILVFIDGEIAAIKKQIDDFYAKRKEYAEFESSVRKGLTIIPLPAPYVAMIDTYGAYLSQVEGLWSGVSTSLEKANSVFDELAGIIKKDLIGFISLFIEKMGSIKESLASAGLNKATIIPGVLEITDIAFQDKALTRVRTLKEEFVKSFEIYVQGLKTLADLKNLSSIVAPIASDFKNVATDASVDLKNDIERFKKINATSVRISGRLFERVEYKDARLYEFTDKGVRCVGFYVEIPAISPLPLYTFKNLKMFKSNCSFLKIGDLGDSTLTQVMGNLPLQEGTIFKTDVDFSPSLKSLSSIPVLYDALKTMPTQFSAAGILTSARNQFKGSKLFAPLNIPIKIPQLGLFQMSEIGMVIMAGTTPGAVKAEIPLRGTIQLDLGSTKALFETEVVVDPTLAQARLSGIWKGDWNVFNTGITIKDPGIAAAMGAAGVTGAGITGEIRLGNKTLQVTTFGDLATPDIAVIGEFKGGLSFKELIELPAQLMGAGQVFNQQEVLKLLPNLVLKECKLIITPKPMVVFGKAYAKGVIINGKADILGKQAELFLVLTKGGLFGTLEFSDFNFGVGGIDLVKVSSLTPGQPLSFVLDADYSRSNPKGLYTDALVQFSPDIFGGFKAQGHIDIAPARIVIKDLKANLLNLGEGVIQAQAGYSLKEMPKDWMFNVTIASKDPFADIVKLNLSSKVLLQGGKLALAIDASFDNKIFTYLSDQVDKALKETGKELTGALRDAASTVEKADKAVEALDKQITEVKKDIERLYAQSVTGQGVKLVQEGIGEVSKMSISAAKEIGKIDDGIVSVAKSVKSLDKEIVKIGKEIVKIANEIANFAEQVGQGVVDLLKGENPVEEAKKRKEKKEKERDAKKEDKKWYINYQKELEAKKIKQQAFQGQLKQIEQKLIDLQKTNTPLSPFAQTLLQQLNKNRERFNKISNPNSSDRPSGAFSSFGEFVKEKKTLEKEAVQLVQKINQELIYASSIDALLKKVATFSSEGKVLPPATQDLIKKLPNTVRSLADLKLQAITLYKELDALYAEFSAPKTKKANRGFDIDLKSMFEQMKNPITDKIELVYEKLSTIYNQMSAYYKSVDDLVKLLPQ